MVYEGRCWKLGDELPIDGALLELKYVHLRITDPEELAKHVLKSIRPEFSENCSPGDLLVAGNRFGHGNAHVQAFRGFSSLKIGIVAEWMPRGAYRACVIAGIPFLPKCPGISELCREGEQLKVNFTTGLVENITTGKVAEYQPIPNILQEIVAAGGSTKYWIKKLNRE